MDQSKSMASQRNVARNRSIIVDRTAQFATDQRGSNDSPLLTITAKPKVLEPMTASMVAKKQTGSIADIHNGHRMAANVNARTHDPTKFATYNQVAGSVEQKQHSQV